MASNRQRGKATEKAIANILGGERVGIFGGEDIRFDGPWSCEVKERKAFVAAKWMDQAVRNAGNKTPVVVVHQHGGRHEKDLVMLRLQDFIDWFGPLVKGKVE